MEKIFFVYETINYEKHFLFEYPITKEIFDYLKYRYNELKKSFINKSNDNNPFVEQKNLLQTFLIRSKNQKTFSFEIIIENLYYISYPTKINQKDYYKENNNIFNKIDLFNIIFVLKKDLILKKNKNLKFNLYLNLQSLSKYFQYEEYSKNYLTMQIREIMKIYEKIFPVFNSNEEKLKENLKNNNLFKNIENIYESFQKKIYSNYEINNKIFNYFFDIKFKDNFLHPFHSIILIKKNYEKLLSNNSNQYLKIFLENCKPYKTIQEICLEKNIDLNLILVFVNNLINWKCAKKIFKIQNTSIFLINHHIKNFDLNKSIEKEKKEKIFKIMETLCSIESNIFLEDLYKKYFSDINNENFLEYIIFLLENEFIIMVSQIIISKLKFKYEYDYENMIIKRFNEISNNFINNNIYKIKDNNNEKNKNFDKNEFFYEDFLEEIKKNENDDYNILLDIMPFIQKKMFIDEIVYFTGFKINEILEIVNKYNYIFNILFFPININE